MKAQHVLYTWDYHHGQATRVLVAGLPALRGATMKEKQAYFAEHCDHIRTSLMREPRGHSNMLGAVLTDPVTSDGDAGLIFIHPQGFFEMCGDSTFSSVAALIDSGMVSCDNPDMEREIRLDTVAGRIDVRVQLKDGEPVAITFDNVLSYGMDLQTLAIEGLGSVKAQLAYGGLKYAFVEAGAVGMSPLRRVPHDVLLEAGTRVWTAARNQVQADLITLWEPLDDVAGARVANFYAPMTIGRTPSGTGLSARLAIETAGGRLRPGDVFVHESLLGLRFSGRVVRTDPAGVIPAITARSFLMGTSQWILHPEDPFRYGLNFANVAGGTKMRRLPNGDEPR